MSLSIMQRSGFFGLVVLSPCLDVDKLNPFPVFRTFVLSPTWMKQRIFQGGVPEWLKGTGCKPVGESLRWFESNPLHQLAVTGRETGKRMTGSRLAASRAYGKQGYGNARV